LLLLLEIYSAITLGLYTFQARKDSSSYLGDPIAHGVLCIRLQSWSQAAEHGRHAGPVQFDDICNSGDRWQG